MCSQYVSQDFAVVAISTQGNLPVPQSTKLKLMAVSIIFRTRTNPGVYRCKKISLRTSLVWKENKEIPHFMITTINVQNLDYNFHVLCQLEKTIQYEKKASYLFP